MQARGASLLVPRANLGLEQSNNVFDVFKSVKFRRFDGGESSVVILAQEIVESLLLFTRELKSKELVRWCGFGKQIDTIFVDKR
jgi:hypothetical protein